MVVSDGTQPTPRRVITSPFDGLGEWGARIDAYAAPASRDDLPGIAGQRAGPRQRASRDELLLLVEAHNPPTAARATQALSPVLSFQRTVAGRARVGGRFAH